MFIASAPGVNFIDILRTHISDESVFFFAEILSPKPKRNQKKFRNYLSYEKRSLMESIPDWSSVKIFFKCK